MRWTNQLNICFETHVGPTERSVTLNVYLKWIIGYFADYKDENVTQLVAWIYSLLNIYLLIYAFTLLSNILHKEWSRQKTPWDNSFHEYITKAFWNWQNELKLLRNSYISIGYWETLFPWNIAVFMSLLIS